MTQIDEIVQEFLIESYDSLDKLDADFIALEENPEDRERLANIFRTIHSVKGTSGFLDFPKLEKVAHVGENLLVPLRDGELQLNNEIVDSLLGMVDAIRDILGNVEESGSEGDGDYTSLIAKLEKAKCPGEAASAPNAAASAASDTTQKPAEESCSPPSEQPPENEINEGEAGNDQTAESQSSVSSDIDSESDNMSQPEPALETEPSSSEGAAADDSTTANKPTTSLAGSTVRISVDLLDQLMNLVGELVLTRNQISQHSQKSSDHAVTTAAQRLNLITSELQEGVMKTRMQPIRNAWSKLPRVVRDLASTCGKQVRVEMEGANTELDKTILEAIKDPLTHIVRNSVDHGIEAPEIREAAGKPAEGTLLLRAFHEGGQVNIEIIDDGGGIKIDRIREKAIKNGLLTPEKANSMSERELTNLILLPGFSTAQTVTNVSGRGVGMDVVRTNIEKIGGSLELQSVVGQGTKLRIKIPLTLAIVPALIIKSAQQQFAIPQVSLLELVRIEAERAEQEIEMIHNVPVYRLRGKLLPLMYLDQQLGLAKDSSQEEPDASDDSPASETATGNDNLDDSVNIVVLQAEDHQFGLVVDAISDTQEIVVKPLGKQLNSVITYAGATIMGDGTVALILDVVGIAQQGGILTEHTEAAMGDDMNDSKRDSADLSSMLIADRGDGIRVAMDLEAVARLEEFTTDEIEQTDSGRVVQYRGGIMPLVSMVPEIASSADDANQVEDSRVQVVVFANNGQNIGVVVGEIIDVVQHPIDHEENRDSNSDPKLLVVQNRVTKVVDLERVVATMAQRETTPGHHAMA